MRIRSIVVTTASAALTLCLLHAPASAYELSGGGGRIGLANPDDINSTVMVGGHLEFEQPGTRVHIQPNLMYWKSQGLSDVNPNLDLYYHFRRAGRPSPYLGAGLAVNMRHERDTDHSDTELGANALGGLRFPGESNNLFLEGRVTAAKDPQVALLGGITFGVR